MFIADSRRSGGSGIWPLQHDDHIKQGIELEMRTGIVAARILKRLTDLEHMGRYLYDPETVGDVNGGMFWPRDTRAIGCWQFAFPSIVTAKKSADVNAPLGAVATEGGASGGGILPMRDEMDADKAFATINPVVPMFDDDTPMFPKYPTGTVGIAMKAMNTEKQIDYFLHCDPRLISVQAAGDPDYSSMVADLTPDNEIDPERIARLHSFWWVIKKPRGGFPFPDRNFLAWNIGQSGRDPVLGGWIIDSPGGGENGRVLGHVSQNLSGPLTVGEKGDIHELGEDRDGHGINSGHIHTNAYFRMDAGRDAPLYFSPEKYEEPRVRGPFLAPTHLRYDPQASHPFVLGPRPGMWKWETETNFYTITPKYPHPKPGDGGGGGVVGGGGQTQPENKPEGDERIQIVAVPIATPPVNVGTGAGDGNQSGPPAQSPQPQQVVSTGVQPFGVTPADASPLSEARGVWRPGDPTDIFDNKTATEADWAALREAGVDEYWPFGEGIPTVGRMDAGGPPGSMLATLMDFVLSNMKFRAMDAGTGALDLGRTPPDALESMGTVDRRAAAEKIDNNVPIVGGSSTFGQQGGQTGTTGKFATPVNTGGSLEPWAYTERPGEGRTRRRYTGGTARGGIIYTPPEVDLMDADIDFRPSDTAVSEFYIMTAPGAYWGAGSVRTSTARPKLGYRWGIDTSNDLLFERTDTWGVPSKTFKATADGLLKFILGDSTSFGSVCGKIEANLTTASTAGTGAEELLGSVTIPAYTLNANGKGVKLKVWGKTAATVNVKVIKIYVGTGTPPLSVQIITNDVTIAPNNLDWEAEIMIFRTSSSNQKYTAELHVGACDQTVQSGTLTYSDTTTIFAFLYAQAVAGGVTVHGMYLEAIT